MSGIAGWLRSRTPPLDRPLASRILDSIQSRGPDRAGSWISGDAALGHSLLATTHEAAAEHQPFTLDGNLRIVADCRIDGRQELRALLSRHGRRDVDTAHDPALILHAFHLWGEACLDHLIGDFAFAIWDPLRRRLFCARDHVGVKLFYYSTPPGELVFSNSLNSVRLHPAVSGRLNDLAILDFLLFGQNQDKATTTFADIHSLPPAHCLLWEDGRLTCRRYWTRPIDEPIHYRQPAAYVEHFNELFHTALRDRLRFPSAAVQMSGGLDSTLIAAHARIAGGPGLNLQAFSVDFGSFVPDDERRHAAIAARHLQIPVHFLRGAEYTLYQDDAQTAAALPEPENSPYYLLGLHLQQRMAAHTRVGFYGEGADNLLANEWKPYLNHLWHGRQYLRWMHVLAESFLLDPRLPFAFSLRRRRQAVATREQDDLPFPDYIHPALVARYHLRQRWDDFWAPATSPHPYHPEAYAAFESPVWHRLVSLFDPGLTGLPLEVRHPFLDIRLARFLLALPVVPWCRRKLILRHSARQVLPPEIWRREKQALSVRPASPAIALPSAPSPAGICEAYFSGYPPLNTASAWSTHCTAAPRCLAHWAASQARP